MHYGISYVMITGMKISKYILIFSGYNQRAVIAFLRTLEKNNITNYLIFACSRDDTIFKTIYADKVYAVRKNKQLDLDEIRQLIFSAKEKKEFDTFLIPPSTEALNRFLLDHMSLLSSLGLENVLVDKNLYETISDKEKFSRLCVSYGMTVPEEIAFPPKFKKKFVAKPKTYFSGDGKAYAPVLITTADEYNHFIEVYQQNDFYYQQFLEGKSIYLLYYITKSKKVYSFSQENLMQQPGGKSVLCAKTSTYHHTAIADVYKNMLLQVGYHGFVMIELRITADNDYMIEANPRFWGPSQLFVDSGYNFFEIFLKEYGFLNDIDPEEPKVEVFYYWSGGFLSPDKKEPVAFGGFEKDFNPDFLIQNDIYKRPDTSQLYIDGD